MKIESVIIYIAIKFTMKVKVCTNGQTGRQTNRMHKYFSISVKSVNKRIKMKNVRFFLITCLTEVKYSLSPVLGWNSHSMH